MTRRTVWWQRGVAGSTAIALVMAQVTLSPQAEAAPGSTTASAGSAPPPAATAIQSFQPDLFTGRATTSIPIAVPPGRKGMQPSLGLSYSSSSRNGAVGVGWSLDVGYIERGTKRGVPKYDASDTYTFLFQGVSSDLVQIPDGTYRAKDEGLFLKFINQGSSGWEVRDKSGTRYQFGTAQGSRLEAEGKTFRWALDQLIDAHGNTLTVSYTTDQAQLYLDHVDYTGHEPSGLPPANHVSFIWEPRPDAETSYRSGFAITTAKRLKEVATYAQGQPAKTYILGYAQSGRTSRSLLASVSQRGTDGVASLSPVTFQYQDTGAPSYAVSSNNPTTSTVAWNLRKANQDTGHENFGCAHPYTGLPWSAPVVVSGAADLGCLNASVGGDGSIRVNGCRDHFMHAYTFVYADTPRAVSLPYHGSESCLWREDASGVQNLGDGSSVPLQAGWSIIHLTGYHQHEDWSNTLSAPLVTLVDLMSPAQFIKPQLAGDVDGDAITDLISFDPAAGMWTVSCATTCTIPPPRGGWLSGFGNGSSVPLLGDWNGDAKTDVATFQSGSWRFATSTGSSFQADGVPTLSFGGGTPLVGDFNGDGVTDLGTYSSGAWSVARGTGSGFTPTDSFSVSWGDGATEPLTGDFNGDGFTDIGLVNKSSGSIDARLSTGTGWTSATQWISGFGAGAEHTSADVDGDGLTDALYYDKNSGTVFSARSTGSRLTTVASLPVSFSLRGAHDQLQLADFNGDGLIDPAVFNPVTNASQLAVSTGPPAGAAPDLLKAIANGLGGTTTIAYQPACQCASNFLPFVHYVVQAVTVDNGLGWSSTTAYTYQGGRYDAATREFRGFADAQVHDPDGNTAATKFLQEAETKGRPKRTTFTDATGRLLTASEQTWTWTTPEPGVTFTSLSQVEAFAYGSGDIATQTRQRLEYDQYGNVTRTLDEGDVAVTGDERTATTAYRYDEAAWRLSQPTLTQTLDAQGAVVAQRRFYYDEATGDLSREETWLDAPERRWPATTLTYDAYGNVQTVTDALGRTTTNTYDDTGTYLVQIQNALGHTRRLTYDPRTGQVLTSTDQNGLTTLTDYDPLGRVVATKFLEPGASEPVVLSEFAYDLSTVPTKTTACVFVEPTRHSPLCTLNFSDGLGRTIQTRSPAEDPAQQVVTGAVELNTRGLVVKQWVPYLSSASSLYVPLSLEPSALSLSSVTYTYDPLGRLLTTTAPDGAVTSVSYDGWTTTATDALGHQTRRTSDASGHLVKVEEVNGSDTYTTTYAYDTAGNLIQVTDALGNLTRIAYDSLGRKLSMDDPDMGHWSYAYDAVDNLTAQTDARGVATTFEYDALNRLTQKAYAVPPALSLEPSASVTYTYDVPVEGALNIGKLVGITDGSGSSTFTYDTLGRLSSETKTVDGKPYTIRRSYDLLGRLIRLTYPDGDAALYTYNPQGGLETINLDSPVTGRLSLVAHVDYNAAGQLTTIAYGNGVTSDYSYDPQTLRLSSLHTQNSALATLQDFSYDFDPIGNVAGITDRVHTGTQGFEYDDLNRLTRATGAYGDLQYRYDPLGNLLEKDVPASGGATASGPVGGLTMSYGVFDPQTGQRTKPHAVTAVSPPGAGAAAAAALMLTYDANGNLLAKTPGSGATAAAADALDDQALTAQQLSYDAENRLIRVDTAPEQTVTLRFLPGWNFFSLPVIPDDPQITTIFPAFSADFEQLAWFDATPETPEDQRFKHFVNDPDFNDFDTLQYGQGYQAYCTNPNGLTVTLKGKLPTQRLSTTLLPGWHLLPAFTLHPTPFTEVFRGIDVEQLLRYDTANGSLTTVERVEPGAAYFVQVCTTSIWTPPLPRDVTTTTVYDGDGGRVKQRTPSGTTTYLGESVEIGPDGTVTKYVFAGSQRLASFSRLPARRAPKPPSTPTTAATRLTTPLSDPSPEPTPLTAEPIERPIRGPRPVPATPKTLLRFYHTDHLGSSNVITDDTGAVVELAEYTPFGSVNRREGSVTVLHGFTGQREDAANGLIRFPARAYDPQLGRFLQPDPFVQEPGDPQTLNRYAYARNNPVKYVDPSGYGFWDWFFGWYFALAAAVLFVVAGFSFLTGAEPVAAAAFNAGLQAAGMSASNFKAAVNDAGSATGISVGLGNTDPFLQSEGPLLLQSPISKGTGGPALPTEAAIAAADLPLESSWGPDDAIYALIGIGVAAKAATVAARELGPVAWAGLRSLANETGAARLGAEGPTLSSVFRNAFQGVRYRTFKPGEKFYRSPWVPQEIASKPGRWFGTRQAVTKAGAKSLYNVRQGNPLQVMRVYEVIKEVTLPYGRVYGGTGFQALFPEGMIPAEYLRYVAEAVLK